MAATAGTAAAECDKFIGGKLDLPTRNLKLEQLHSEVQVCHCQGWLGASHVTPESDLSYSGTRSSASLA